jgi:hypothetical protein
MNKVLIEHSGTSYYNTLAQEVSDVLEYVFDLEVEHMIGPSYSPLVIYTEGGSKVVDLTAVPNRESLRMLLSLNNLI